LDLLVEYRRHLLTSYRILMEKLTLCLPLAQKTAPKDDNGWSLPEVISHLLMEEKGIYCPVLGQILLGTTGEMLLRGETDYPGDEWRKGDLTANIKELQSLYQEKLDLLSVLQHEEWGKTARHKTLGIRTFQWWVERSWYHAAWHLAQFNMHDCGE